MSSPDPATIHGRTIALVQHVARGDREAIALVAAEPLTDVTTACAQILSLASLGAYFVRFVPEAERDQLFSEIAVSMAREQAG